jgi:glycolate oxidase FAD binding subunit
MAGLNRVVDYPARDMTITVEAGVTIDSLAATLAAERQALPIDLPSPAAATIGGSIATAWSGPRRYGYGTLRDYVIGITAIDGRGTPFKAGGRVVKNVAGYDFCKLLTGSLGTLGVITQVTLKVKPLPEAGALLCCGLPSIGAAEPLLAALVNSKTTPTSIELLTGPHWQDHPHLGLLTAGEVGRLVVGFEGTEAEVAWMLDQLAAEWRALGVRSAHTIDGPQALALNESLRDFAAATDAPLVLKACLRASGVAPYVELVGQLDPQASIQAHAGSGIVIARFQSFDAGDVSGKLIGRLQPAATAAGGSAVVLSSSLGGLTRQAIWGGTTAATPWMNAVKRQFDPKGILNPGRFVYETM